MAPREATKPPAGAIRPEPPPRPPAKAQTPDPWDRLAGALESMAIAISGLTETQKKLGEGVSSIQAALTGNAAAIKSEVDRQGRRNAQIRALADEVRGGPRQPPAERPE